MSQKLYNEYKKFEFCEKNGLNFKLKHRNAQNSILSGRFGALTGRPGDSRENWESWQVCNSNDDDHQTSKVSL